MLRRPPSLARQAALVFALVYAAILLAVLALNAAASWADRGHGNLRGPNLAIDYASGELRWSGERPSLPTSGRFAGLKARNPASWLIVVRGGRTWAAGAVPPAAMRSIRALDTIIGTATLRLPGPDGGSDAMSVQRRETRHGPVLLAAGGVDPATLLASKSVDQLLNPGVVIMLAVIAAISLFAMWAAVPAFSRALRPITAEAERIGPGDPGRRLDLAEAPKELVPLAAAFNTALDRLEAELGRRRRFIADVAHELRTPLAVIALRVDTLENGPDREPLKRGLAGLTHLVAQMLDLERLSLSSERRSDVDLGTIARDVVADLAPMAIARGYDLALSAPDRAVVVSAEAHGIIRALTNVISNAVLHAGGSGQIMVLVSEDRTITVSDEGPGITGALRERLFEPFSRGETEAEGSGLGLHIAREIMRLHGGDIVILPDANGATFQLRFPDYR